ncbi:hypothetical protein AAMO2058_001327500 [Amorphochlora amoebiformis]
MAGGLCLSRAILALIFLNSALGNTARLTASNRRLISSQIFNRQRSLASKCQGVSRLVTGAPRTHRSALRMDAEKHPAYPTPEGSFLVDDIMQGNSISDSKKGVYVVFDDEAQPQFVGYSDDIPESIAAHRDNVGPQRCSSYRVEKEGEFQAVQARIAVAASVQSLGVIPPGNSAEAWKWELKGTEQSNQIISPFANSAPVDDISFQPREFEFEGETPPFTLEGVDLVLDKIRPMLIADGGNVKVMSVSDGVVAVTLMGNCGSCSASTETIKYGIEKTLFQTFGHQFNRVVQVHLTAPATLEAVNKHLALFKPALQRFSGDISCIAVLDGVATVMYKGPDVMYKGVVKALQDRFPGQINRVDSVEWMEGSDESTSEEGALRRGSGPAAA